MWTQAPNDVSGITVDVLANSIGYFVLSLETGTSHFYLLDADKGSIIWMSEEFLVSSGSQVYPVHGAASRFALVDATESGTFAILSRLTGQIFFASRERTYLRAVAPLVLKDCVLRHHIGAMHTPSANSGQGAGAYGTSTFLVAIGTSSALHFWSLTSNDAITSALVGDTAYVATSTTFFTLLSNRPSYGEQWSTPLRISSPAGMTSFDQYVLAFSTTRIVAFNAISGDFVGELTLDSTCGGRRSDTYGPIVQIRDVVNHGDLASVVTASPCLYVINRALEMQVVSMPSSSSEVLRPVRIGDILLVPQEEDDFVTAVNLHNASVLWSQRILQQRSGSVFGVGHNDVFYFCSPNGLSALDHFSGQIYWTLPSVLCTVLPVFLGNMAFVVDRARLLSISIEPSLPASERILSTSQLLYGFADVHLSRTDLMWSDAIALDPISGYVCAQSIGVQVNAVTSSIQSRVVACLDGNSGSGDFLWNVSIPVDLGSYADLSFAARIVAQNGNEIFTNCLYNSHFQWLAIDQRSGEEKFRFDTTRTAD